MHTAASHRPAAEVEQALFALNDGTHPFEVVRNGQRIEAVWRHGARGPGVVFGSVEWRYRVTLLGESGQYKDSVFAKNFDDDNTYFDFRSTDVSRPVKAVLAEHGWTHRPNAFSRFFRGLLGR
ncbi:hypothetical protein [Curtobacterium sp. MCBA15_008]|uniref:hypothetical protein n=1 Tax=Curtobacterium sp. MCBA15_008 TaxID=1898736 RepID=UPI0008DC9300|nr:hypothetical protein [Curtobacterium sp. MCBA15_008]OII14746.1 hypothetical protein BIU96_09540 [Curtobacterium sp. MCBA15_008]